ncbi:MAG TPA: high-potential iron-sulfur protein [Caulobacteraceae bacterium]|nr:high-potential iron-sulfur protein [Caulobacteraceae bacterium]
MFESKLHTLDLSRRGFIRSVGLAAGVGLIGASLAATPAAASSKFSQAMAKYQPTPKAPGQTCSTCTQFQPAAACKVVEGEISANGWCFLYAKKG